MKKKYLLKILILLVIFTAGCGSDESAPDLKNIQTVTATLQPSAITLYFSGTIGPVKVMTVNSSIDGTVIKKNFDYGTNIDKGQLLLVIKSAQLAEEYQTSLTTYLKAKKDYLNNLTQMRGTDYLKSLGIISENEYITTQSTNYDLELSYNQAARKLQQTLEKMGTSVGNIMELHIEQAAAVHKALAQPADLLNVIAPTSGIALMPSKSSGGSDDSSGSTLTVGNQVKTGQVLLGIGDSTGFAFLIKVNEININNIKVGQTATITSDAFPNITLKGKVEYIVQQAVPGESGGTPTFPVNIIVSHLTPEQRKIIHMGMSAKVALQVESKPAIRVPISAVVMDQGVATVKVLDEKRNKILTVPVVTGATTLDSVEIQQGLKPGEKVIVNATNQAS